LNGINKYIVNKKMILRNQIKLLLSKTEKFVQTDIKYIAKGGFWLTFGNVISLLASFLSSIAFANLLTENNYGIFRYILSAIGILSIPCLSGINTAVSKAVSEGFESTLYLGLKTKFKYGLLASLASLILGGYYFLNHNTVLTFSFLITAVLLPLMEASYLFTSFLNAKKLFKLSAKYSIITKISTTALLVAVAYFYQSIPIIILTYLLSHTLSRIISLLIIIKKNKPNNKVDSKAITYGKHLSFITFLGQISSYLDKILIFSGIGAPALAGYYLSLVPFKHTQNIFNNINILAFPKFANNNFEEIKKTLPKKVLKLYLIIIPLIALYFFIAPYAFRLIYPKYLEWADISRIFMLLLMFYPLTLFSTALTALGQKNKLYVNTAFYSICRIILLVITIPIFGINGAIFSMVATYILSNSMLIFLFYKK